VSNFNMIASFLTSLGYAKVLEKNVKNIFFVNSALRLQLHIVKNTLLQRAQKSYEYLVIGSTLPRQLQIVRCYVPFRTLYT